MPAPNDLIPDLLDDANLGTTVPSDGIGTPARPIPSTGLGGGKTKKKKAGKKAKQSSRWAGADDTYGKSVSPSPPGEDGVMLVGAAPAAVTEPTPPLSETEPERATAVELDDDMGAWRGDEVEEYAVAPPEPEPEPEPEPSAWLEPEPLPAEQVASTTMDYHEYAPAAPSPVRDLSPVPAPATPSPVRDLSPVPAPAAPSPTTRSPRPQPVQPMAPTAPAPASRIVQPHPSRGAEHEARKPNYALPRRPRRGSTPQQDAARHRKSFVEPSFPPHLAQSHFYAAPGLDFGMGVAKQEIGAGKQAGSDHYCCCFDSFSSAGDAASAVGARDVLLVGEEGGLQVYRVLSDKMEVVGRLEGLRGAVVGAKVLPAVGGRNELEAPKPLVAVVLHGPMVKERRDTILSDDSGSDSIVEDKAKRYQTTVEVFSLQTQQHLSTLYKSLPVALPEAVLGQAPTLPEPVGNLRLDAKGHFLTIASGKSGEVFIFTSKPRPNETEASFRCVGKYWTSLQSRFDVQPRPNSAHDGIPASDVPEPQTSPLLSLGGRWLALVPPSTGSKTSVQGTLALLEGHRQPPGVGLHSAPPQPAVTCDVVGLNGEGVLARFSRQAAQEIVKASRRGIEMGRAGWREFTQPSPPSRPVQGHARADSGEMAFPPTNAPPGGPWRRDQGGFANEPTVVSILDLDRLLDAEEHQAKHLPTPLASFAVEDGCNYLSLSTDGMRLLTTSRKGELSTVWDVRHAAHGSARPKDTEDGSVLGPHITRLHRIVRASQSIVLDAVWARDGHVAALLTANGTVHLHELSPRSHSPSSRRRRRSTVVSPAEKASATVSVSQGLSPPSANSFLGSIRSGWQTMSTQVGAMRSSTGGVPATLWDVTNAGAAAGSRAVARGLQQGYSAARVGVGDIWHADDNKIRHKQLAEAAGARSISWLKRRSGLAIAVACKGKVLVHPIQQVTRQRGESTFTGLKAERGGKREFELPSIASRAVGDVPGCAQMGPHGFWSLRAVGTELHTRSARPCSRDLESDKARYETNPPFCPFYIDRRVAMLGYEGRGAAAFEALGHALGDEQAWLFGQAMPSATRLNERLGSSEASFAAQADSEAGQEEDEERDGESIGEREGGSEQPNAAQSMVESRVVVSPDSRAIRISTRLRKKAVGKGKGKSRREDGLHSGAGTDAGSGEAGAAAAAATADGEFDLLEDAQGDLF